MLWLWTCHITANTKQLDCQTLYHYTAIFKFMTTASCTETFTTIFQTSQELLCWRTNKCSQIWLQTIPPALWCCCIGGKKSVLCKELANEQRKFPVKSVHTLGQLPHGWKGYELWTLHRKHAKFWYGTLVTSCNIYCTVCSVAEGLPDSIMEFKSYLKYWWMKYGFTQNVQLPALYSRHISWHNMASNNTWSTQ